MALLLGCIGESFAECNSTVNGLMLKLRPNRPVVVQIWVAHSEGGKLKAFAHSLRETLEKVIGSKQLQRLEYYSHNQKQSGHGQNSLASRISSKPKSKPDLVF
ncbi:hypothetical protein STCU_04282 [Strigomonas culicis]|nr:hypothetical protein STCU_04282 [Strigomonas culicis]|eukprot:EPY30008.1 hypothetical protein STCU_04282 [Strigomonas culicis]